MNENVKIFGKVAGPLKTRNRLEGFATWVGGGVASAFFASLEKTSCVGLAVADDDGDEEGEELMTGRFMSDKLRAWDDETRDWSLIEPESCRMRTAMTDLFAVGRFHHVEFWCGDASNPWRRMAWGLGMNLVAKSDQSTGNQTFCSYAIRSNELVFAFTAPYSKQIDQSGSKMPLPGYKTDEAKSFSRKHGLAVRAVGILVQDAEKAFRIAVKNGAEGIVEPTELIPESGSGKMKVAEVMLYADVVLRFVSNHGFTGPYLPNFEPVESVPISYGIQRLGHVVGNVSNLMESAKYVGKFTGFHKVTEYTTSDVGTVDSGLNGVALANNNEMVSLVMNEPVYYTNRKSQIETFMEHNGGPGLQHLALLCDDIFFTVREMRMRSSTGGFEFLPNPPAPYYNDLLSRFGGILTEKQCRECEELGILVGKDDEGVLLRIFTKPLGDRPTTYFEVIQRIGGMQSSAGRLVQKGGCGGFSKEYFSELFKAIEQYEITLIQT